MVAECGISPRIFEVLEPAALILGGENSLRGNFPWMAAVFTHHTYDKWILMCGGTLISPSIVLTGNQYILLQESIQNKCTTINNFSKVIKLCGPFE